MKNVRNDVWLRLENIPVPLEAAQSSDQLLRAQAAKRLGLVAADVAALTVVRRSLDARRQQVRFSFSIDIAVAASVAHRLIAKGRATARPQIVRTKLFVRHKQDGPPPVVAGAGPAGLFAALALAEAGWPPVIIERGKPVERRGRDVSQLYSRGVLDLNSNVCFGEGGAGTYSDGKLYSRVGDPRIADVLEALVHAGAPTNILVDGRPHIGTDKLVRLLAQLRARLITLGAVFHFDTALTDFTLANGRVSKVALSNGSSLDCRHLVLATGHSAHEVWNLLAQKKLPLACRPFAVGFRVEHPQMLVDTARYGSALAQKGILPAADYRLAYNESSGTERPGRGAFSFCMCPGGVVVTTPTEYDALCINGMSHAARKGRFANSALVVSVGPQDFADEGFHGDFAGVAFQRRSEQLAYQQGTGAFVAPAARLTDFVSGKVSSDLSSTSYRRGLVPGDLALLYPLTVIDTLKRAMGRFAQTLPGFLTQEATLIGVETRTASPVRLLRDDFGQTPGALGLFPAGEGMGYGGGIVSAAVDGIRAAEAALKSINAQPELQKEAPALG